MLRRQGIVKRDPISYDMVVTGLHHCEACLLSVALPSFFHTAGWAAGRAYDL